MMAPLVFVALLGLGLGLVFIRERSKHVNPKVNSATEKPDIFSRVIYSFVFIFANMFTFLATKVLAPLECYRQPDGSFTMVLSPSERCFEGAWSKNYPAVVFFALLYLGIAPLSLTVVFIMNRGNIFSSKFLRKFGALIRPYAPALFFWEIVVTAKKTLFVVLVKAVADVSIYRRYFFLVCFLVFFMALENVCKPYRNLTLNGLNALWNLVAVFMLLSGALVFEPMSTSDSSRIAVAFLVVIAVLFAVFSSFIRATLNIIFRYRMGMDNNPKDMNKSSSGAHNLPTIQQQGTSVHMGDTLQGTVEIPSPPPSQQTVIDETPVGISISKPKFLQNAQDFEENDNEDVFLDARFRKYTATLDVFAGRRLQSQDDDQ
jgi:hypothetical protein